MIKYTHLLFIAIAALCIQSCKNPIDVSPNENFNQGWLFSKSNDTLALPLADTQWESVDLPHTANIEPLTVNDQWQGICFYQKNFTLNSNYRHKILSLQFDAAMNVADVWVNGKKAIHHMGGYLPFVVDLNSMIRFDTINTVLVRLDNRDNPITGPKPLEILDFNMYGGLYRNVHLIVKNKIHLTHPIKANKVAGGGVFFATTMADKQQASFEIKSQIQNTTNQTANISIIHQLIDSLGQNVATLTSPQTAIDNNQSVEIVLNGSLEAPLLWSPQAPNLYTLRTEVYADGQLTDVQTDRVGIRTIKITPQGLSINNQQTFLRGVNRHQEYPYVGYAMSDAAQYRDAYQIKQAGFDFVRCSHYPMSPAFLDACDELGIMVLDAILGWQYFGDAQFEKLALESSRQLIRRDRNHPSILAWELSINETAMPATFVDSASIIAHQEYPYKGCYSAGWVRQAYDVYIEARQHRHELYPEKPLLVSEYGDWEYYAQNAGFNQQEWKDLMEEERTSRQSRQSGEKRMLQQALNIQEAHNDNLSTHAFADGYWVMFDYNRGMAPDHEYSGIMDIFRLPKFSYYFFKSQRSASSNNPMAEPMVFIASYWQPGESNSVRIFSNCDEVELFVDGQSAGRKKTIRHVISNNLSHPPFSFDVACGTPGTLKAVGYLNGKSAASHSISTPGDAARLTLRVDESGIAPTRNDVILVHAYVTDKNGNTVNASHSEVTFNIEGAQLVGPVTTPALAGIATALVRTKNTSGKVTITATCNGLESGKNEFIIP